MTPSTNITRSDSTVSAFTRSALLGHRAVTVWMTGLSGSGKSTLANAAEASLVDHGVFAYVLDGDNPRFGLNSDLGFTPSDRAENIRRAGQVCALMRDAGVVVLASFISPYRSDRRQVRDIHAAGDFVEVFVDAPLQVCEQRDPKGLYAKARSGVIPSFTGVSAPYEAPVNPELHIRTGTCSIEDATEMLVGYVLTRIRDN